MVESSVPGGSQPERRVGNLSYEPAEGLLVVGARTAVLEREAPPDAVIGSYVELVVAQRATVPATHLDLRNRELVQLSSLLELPQDDLDALIDRELARLLGRSVPVLDTFVPVEVAGGSGFFANRRRLLVVSGLAALAIAGAVGVSVASQAPAADLPGGSTGIGTGTGTVEVIELEDGGTATRTESSPAPVGEDGTDVGTAVVIERNP